MEFAWSWSAADIADIADIADVSPPADGAWSWSAADIADVADVSPPQQTARGIGVPLILLMLLMFLLPQALRVYSLPQNLVKFRP